MSLFNKLSLSIESLYFDIENPRLVRGDNNTPSQDDTIIQTLHEIADLSELINSICANGYLDIEPLIVLPRGTTPETYTVLEGNRRLATLKLISNPVLATECKINIPEGCQQSASKSFENLSAVVVNNRFDAESYIAFKHVNGAFRWDSYAKARFVTDWYVRSKEAGTPIAIEEIAKKIGDSNDTIRSFISSMLILDQAENEGLFKISDKYNRGRFGFSHLYTALGRKEYSKYLDLELGWDKNPDLQPIKTDKQKERFGEVFQYFYGSKTDNIPPLIKSQNPDLKNLGMVISNPIAHAILKDTRDLDKALVETKEKSDVFESSLTNCYIHLRKAQGMMDKYDGEAHLLEMSEEIYKMSENILEYVKRKVKKA
ncbi:MAG: ParB N-terminal domain-containing protein [Campylobacterota bacterium]